MKLQQWFIFKEYVYFYVLKIFLKKIIFLFEIIFLVFLYYFDVLMLKIIFFKKYIISMHFK
jgi:hypothetical protein